MSISKSLNNLNSSHNLKLGQAPILVNVMTNN
jgi:hypothetical protein